MSDEKTFSLHIFTLDAGGGHCTTLKALSAIAQQKRPWQITITDISELSEPINPY